MYLFYLYFSHTIDKFKSRFSNCIKIVKELIYHHYKYPSLVITIQKIEKNNEYRNNL
jgi:hypothetical protein